MVTAERRPVARVTAVRAAMDRADSAQVVRRVVAVPMAGPMVAARMIEDQMDMAPTDAVQAALTRAVPMDPADRTVVGGAGLAVQVMDPEGSNSGSTSSIASSMKSCARFKN